MTTSKAVHSQAFGFMSYVQGGVDPRTGQYTVSINLPEVKSNWLGGPAFPLSLTFNPINTLDSGFGVGWNLNLTQFTPHNSILALSTGETFKVTGSGAVPGIKEKKLDSFHFENLGNDRYRVLHKSGMIEELQVGGSNNDRVALPVEIKSPAGHCLTLAYASFRGGQRLQSISDAQGELLRINRQANDEWVEVLVRPYDGAGGVPLARYEMKLNASGWVTEIVLPTADKGSWRFGYGNGPIRDILCLHEVKTPVGGRETIEYTDTGHPYPGGVTRPNLPRVTRHRSYPGFDQPMMEVEFSYTAHNFLGAGESVSWEDGMDPLYKLSASYDYASTASLLVGGQVARKVERTYNRFHLLTEEKTTQDNCVKRVKTQYYAADVPFEQQVAQFQLPKAVTTSWELSDDATQYRAEIAGSAYDEYGNQTEQVEPNGIKTVYTYYPKAGENGCPPDRFVRNLKDTTVIPSPQGEPGAPTLRTRLRYTAHKPLTGSGLEDWLAIDSETLVQIKGTNETQLQQTLRSYNELPDDALLHGRPVSQQTTLNGTTSTTLYEYEKLSSVLAGETVLETRELFTGFDGVEKTMSQQNSLITGETVLSSDLDGVRLLRQFDVLGRVTKEIVSPSTDAQAERIYTYTLTSADGQQSSQSVTEVRGVTTHTRFDGQGRLIYQELAEKTKAPRQIFSAAYDALDNRIEEIRYDWLDDKSMPLRQGFEYDAWGVAYRETMPDGAVSNYLWSPFGKKGPIEYKWLETPDTETTLTISGLTGGKYNEFGKLDRFERLDAQPLIDLCHELPERPVAEHLRRLLDTSGLPIIGAVEYAYDGTSNCVQQTELYDGQERNTRFAYDAWNRVEATTMPDNTVISRTFAEHSFGEQTTSMRVKPAAKPEVIVGHQSFDSLQRLTQRSVGSTGTPRIEEFKYTGSQMQPSQRISAAKEVFDYEYKSELTLQPLSIKTPEEQSATYVYDPKTGVITSAKNNQGEREYRYTDIGQLEYESWTDTDGTQMETTYITSLHGRQLSRRHTDGLDTLYTYDDFGRAKTVTQGELHADFDYNTLGQLRCTTTRSPESTLTADVKYDTQGREVERTLKLNELPSRVITQTWQGDNQLKSRQVQYDGNSLLNEEFVYDSRNRLIHHTCAGTALPKDVYGNKIVSQLFKFDELDNIQRVTTQFADGLSDIAAFTYATDDSCQLRQITHTYTAGGYPGVLEFDYDANGHMLNDEHDQRLVYDSHGRLVAVKDSKDQVLTTYRYDGHNHLVGVRQGDEHETLRFYQGYGLSHTLHNGTYTQYLFHGERPLGQQQVDDHNQTVLLMTDASPNVIGECLQSDVQTVVYSAYGVRSSDDELRSLLAFNSEVCENVNNWYLLGRGYRVYNPNLMRFHSPDSFSPFGAGGVNPYAYCLGNPITFRDPTGHRATYHRPENPGYIDPVEEPETSIWGKIATYAFAAIALVAAIAVVVVTGGAALAVIGAVVVAVGVVMTVYGTEANDEGFATAGMILTAIGGLVSGGAYFRGKSGAKSPANVSGSPRSSVSSGGNRSRAPSVTSNNSLAGDLPGNSGYNSPSRQSIAAQDGEIYFGNEVTLPELSNHSSRSSSFATPPIDYNSPANSAPSTAPSSPAPQLRSGREESDRLVGSLTSLQKIQKGRSVITTEGAFRA